MRRRRALKEESSRPPDRADRREAAPVAAPAKARAASGGSNDIIRLQQAVGNRIVARAIGAKAEGASKMPSEAPLKPVIAREMSEAALKRQAAQQAMLARFPGVWRNFTRDWFDAMSAALTGAERHDDALTARSFDLTLGGNVAWAFTTLGAPALGALKGPAKAAILAKDVMATAPRPEAGRDDETTGRAAIVKVLTVMREALASPDKAVLAEVAAKAAGDAAASGDPEAEDKLLFQRFAPSAAYLNRVAMMTEETTKTLVSWREQFEKQFKEWKARPDVLGRAREYVIENAALSGPIDMVMDRGGGSPAEAFIEMVLKDIPFEPQFAGSETITFDAQTPTSS